MTTIAYKDGVLAGDTRVSDDDGFVWTDSFRKVFKLKSGCLFGASGDTEGGEILLRALRRGITLPALPDGAEIAAVLILPDRTIHISEGSIWLRWPEPFVAIGSGKKAAMGAMLAGADAQAAVAAGMKCDTYSGGHVQAVYLDAPARRRKRKQ